MIRLPSFSFLRILFLLSTVLIGLGTNDLLLAKTKDIKTVERHYLFDSGRCVRGNVYDRAGNPIINAQVSLYLSENPSVGTSTSTDKKGYFIFRKVPLVKALDLKISANGYQDVIEKQLTIDESHSILVTFHLSQIEP